VSWTSNLQLPTTHGSECSSDALLWLSGCSSAQDALLLDPLLSKLFQNWLLTNSAKNFPLSEKAEMKKRNFHLSVRSWSRMMMKFRSLPITTLATSTVATLCMTLTHNVSKSSRFWTVTPRKRLELYLNLSRLSSQDSHMNRWTIFNSEQKLTKSLMRLWTNLTLMETKVLTSLSKEQKLQKHTKNSWWNTSRKELKRLTKGMVPKWMKFKWPNS
jgi:hypothetical protein